MLYCSIFSALILALCICPTLAEIQIGDGVELLPTTRPERLLPDKKYKYYDTVVIDDPAERSAGIYFRISQRGVDYLANLTSEGLPEIFRRMVLPSISDSGLTLTDAVISEFDRPEIAVKFMKGKGLHISVVLTEVQVRGSAELTVFFATYRAQVLAVIKNLTVHVDVFIGRNLDQEHTNVTVTKCSVDPGNLTLQYFGQEASEFYTIGELIEDGITDGIRGKICALPTLVRDFVREKAAYVMQPPQPTSDAPQTTPMSAEAAYYANKPSFSDHLCSDVGEDPISTMMPDLNEPGDPEVVMPEDGGSWVPDLTLRYPPTFSGQDLVFGIDGGVLFNGVSAPGNISRPKFANVTIIRDQIPSRTIRPKFGIIQMLGLIVSEYVLNTMFFHIYDQGLGSVQVTYGYKNIPSVFQSMAKLACPDCKFIVKANLTSPPISAIDRNGIVLHLEGDVGIHFSRKNTTRNLLSASGLIRVTIKPHFRHSRLYSDIALAGVDFKVYKAGMSGLMAGAVRKIVSFLIPRAIWPKIQQRLRIAVNYKGIQIPRFCTVEPRRLHIDYVKHAAVITGDFDVDLPRLVDSFKKFMEQKLRHTRTKAELDDSFRYLRR